MAVVAELLIGRQLSVPNAPERSLPDVGLVRDSADLPDLLPRPTNSLQMVD